MEFPVLRNRNFKNELIFKTSRSSGPGGQNVNKVSTKVELRFHINNSENLTEHEKEILLQKLNNKINSDGFLILVSQSERSQILNKEKVIDKFYNLIEKSLTSKKPRKQTKPTQSSIEKRLQEKRIVSEKKILRNKIQ